MVEKKPISEIGTKVFQLWLKGIKYKEIAEQLEVSEANISQTIKRLRERIKKTQDTVVVLEEMGLIDLGPRFRLTDRGKRLFEQRRQARRPRVAMNVLWEKGSILIKPLPAIEQSYIYAKKVRGITNEPPYLTRLLKEYTKESPDNGGIKIWQLSLTIPQ